MNQNTTNFKRAIFLSWYCSKGDCRFCYMSTQKDLIKEPKKAKRTYESIFAEAIITKACGWEIEFLSGGYDSYTSEELLFILKTINKITGKKQWLNIGVLSKAELEKFSPFVEGFTGAVECITPKVQKIVCPSKPIKPITDNFKICDSLSIKKGMTMIVGIGETIDDFTLLEKFIEKHKLQRITFYALNPQKGTEFTKSPEIDYYISWIKKTREAFPDIEIIGGAWVDKTNYFSKILINGADYFTKFPAIKYFGSKKAKEVEKEVRLAKRKFLGTLTKMPNIDWDKEIENLDLTFDMKKKLKIKISQYIKTMGKNNQ